MAAVLRFAGLLRSSLRSGGHFRSLSALAVRTLPKDDDYCYIIGRHGDLRVPSKGIMELCHYFKHVPLFDRATVGRLIQEVPEEYPHLTSGKIRDCLRTGLIPLYLAKLRGYSLSPADYKEDNLGIHPPTGTIVFRSATMTPYEGEGNCYKPFLSLLKALVGKYTEPGALYPGGLNKMKEYLELSNVKDHLVIYDPCFFSSKPLIAAMQIEIYRILMEECPARGLGNQAKLVIRQLEMRFPKFMQKCMNHALLLSFSGAHGEKAIKLAGKQPKNVLRKKDLTVMGKRMSLEGVEEEVDGAELTSTLLEAARSVPVTSGAYKEIKAAKEEVIRCIKKFQNCNTELHELLEQKGLFHDMHFTQEASKDEGAQLNDEDGCAVVDTHRHGAMHAIKLDNSFLVKFLPSCNQESLGKRAHDLNDVIDLFQCSWPAYLSVAAVELDDQGLWERLDLKRRFALPDIYSLAFGENDEMWIIEFIP